MAFTRNPALRFALIATFVFTLAGGRAEAKPPSSYLTNVELMQLVARGAIREGLLEFGYSEDGPLRIEGGEPTEVDWIVENEIVSALSAAGIGVRVGVLRRPVAAGKPQTQAKRVDLSFPVDVAPVFLEGEGVAYPGEACEKGLEGEVTIALIVNEAGSVANVIVEESTGEPFESAVSRAVEAYRFKPGERDGKAAPSKSLLRFRFPALEEGCESARVEGVPPSSGTEPKGESPAPAAAVGTSSGPEVPSGAPVLRFQVSEAELRYPDVGRRFWFGPKRVERFARIRVDLRLQRGSDVIWSESAEHYVSDRVPHGALRYLENDQYTFAKPVAAPGGAARIVEPLAVAGVIGGLVLLFYANQTGN
ncbi:MAG: energy transducer TonB [Candidatus Eisenbacteria bacterium]